MCSWNIKYLYFHLYYLSIIFIYPRLNVIGHWFIFCGMKILRKFEIRKDITSKIRLLCLAIDYCCTSVSCASSTPFDNHADVWSYCRWHGNLPTYRHGIHSSLCHSRCEGSCLDRVPSSSAGRTPVEAFSWNIHKLQPIKRVAVTRTSLHMFKMSINSDVPSRSPIQAASVAYMVSAQSDVAAVSRTQPPVLTFDRVSCVVALKKKQSYG